MHPYSIFERTKYSYRLEGLHDEVKEERALAEKKEERLVEIQYSTTQYSILDLGSPVSCAGESESESEELKNQIICVSNSSVLLLLNVL